MPPAPEKSPASPAPPAPPSAPDAGDDPPGLPFFKTWRGVYWFVTACFVFYVILLAALPRVFA